MNPHACTGLQTCPTENSNACPGMQLNYNCTGGNAWLIEGANGDLVAEVPFSNSNSTFGNDNQFEYVNINTSTSELRFKVKPDYNGYSVICNSTSGVLLTCTVTVNTCKLVI